MSGWYCKFRRRYNGTGKECDENQPPATDHSIYRVIFYRGPIFLSLQMLIYDIMHILIIGFFREIGMGIHNIIIIGGGPAGLTAGIYAKRAGLDAVLIEKTFSGGQITTTHMLENYTAFPDGIAGMEFGQKAEEHARRCGLEILYEDAKSMQLEGAVKKIVTDQGEHAAKAVILAMGAQPRLLGLPMEKELRGRGVSYCATCDGAFFRGKDIAVVGGGNVAMEEAEFLSTLCSKVYVVHRRDEFRAVGVQVERVMQKSNIEVLWNCVVEGLIADNFLTGLSLRNVVSGELSSIAVSGMFVAIGTIPNTELLGGALELDGWGYIVTDANMATRIPGVYAAGDIRVTPLRQVITACADGAVAAESARMYLMEQQ